MKSFGCSGLSWYYLEFTNVYFKRGETSYKDGQTKHEKTEAIGEKNHKNWIELEHGDNKLHWITLLITDKIYDETIQISAANEDTSNKQYTKLKGVFSYPVLDILLNILTE
jgi:hypothetical protein